MKRSNIIKYIELYEEGLESAKYPLPQWKLGKDCLGRLDDEPTEEMRSEQERIIEKRKAWIERFDYYSKLSEKERFTLRHPFMAKPIDLTCNDQHEARLEYLYRLIGRLGEEME